MHYLNIPNLELSRLAESDLEDIAQHTYSKYGEGQLGIYLSALNQAMNMIVENPAIGHVRDDIPKSYRAIQVEHHIVVYTAKNQLIYIARIFHENMELSGHRIEV